MTTQLENITDLATQLIVDGKATFDNAIEMAIKNDIDNCLKAFEDISDMRRGYINENNKTQKAYQILLESTYKRLSA